MRFILPFLLLSATALGQYDPHLKKTKINDFIESPSVTWAAYANDSLPVFSQFFANVALPLFKEGKIKAVRYAENATAAEDHFEYISFKNYIPENPHYLVPVYDSLGNLRGEYEMIDTAALLNKFNTPFASVYQVLYVDQSGIRSYISRVSPRVAVITPAGRMLGTTELLSFFLNKDHETGLPKKKSNMTFIGSTKKMIMADSIPANERLKELYGHNIIYSLWPGMMSDRYSMFLPGNNQKITAKNFAEGNIPGIGTEVQVPVFDSLGNMTGTKIFHPEIIPQDFNRIELVQQWYYDSKKQVIVCRIPEASLYTAKEYYSPGIASPETTVIRIVF